MKAKNIREGETVKDFVTRNQNRTFQVLWEIEVTASNFEEAAAKALAIQRDPDSIATVFIVTDVRAKKTKEVDLSGGSEARGFKLRY